MPKSSTDTRRPRSTRRRRALTARSGSATIALSVTSSLSSAGGQAGLHEQLRATASASSGSSRLRIETLTAIRTGVPASRHATH